MVQQNICMAPTSSKGFLQNVGENFHLNFVVKEFPVDNSKFDEYTYINRVLNRQQTRNIKAESFS
jgi:hypothetical protein